MRRVVITGAGIVSCIGQDLAAVTNALKNGESGITFNESYAEHGFKSQVSGSIDNAALDTSGIDRKLKRFFSDASLYAYVSALDAIKQSGLPLETINQNPRVAVVASSGGASTENVLNSVDAMREKACAAWARWQCPKRWAAPYPRRSPQVSKSTGSPTLSPRPAPPQRIASVMPPS